MNGREIQKAAADFTEAQMKPSNMQNLSTVLNRMIMTEQDDDDYNDDNNSTGTTMITTMFTTMITTMIITMITTMITTMSIMMTTTQDRYNSEESLEEENQSTTSSTESRQSDFAKKDDGFIPTRRSDHQMSRKYKTQIQIKCK